MKKLDQLREKYGESQLKQMKKEMAAFVNNGALPQGGLSDDHILVYADHLASRKHEDFFRLFTRLVERTLTEFNLPPSIEQRPPIDRDYTGTPLLPFWEYLRAVIVDLYRKKYAMSSEQQNRHALLTENNTVTANVWWNFSLAQIITDMARTWLSAREYDHHIDYAFIFLDWVQRLSKPFAFATRFAVLHFRTYGLSGASDETEKQEFQKKSQIFLLKNAEEFITDIKDTPLCIEAETFGEYIYAVAKNLLTTQNSEVRATAKQMLLRAAEKASKDPYIKGAFITGIAKVLIISTHPSTPLTIEAQKMRQNLNTLAELAGAGMAWTDALEESIILYVHSLEQEPEWLKRESLKILTQHPGFDIKVREIVSKYKEGQPSSGIFPIWIQRSDGPLA